MVGCDNQFAYTLMDSPSSTEPYIVRVLLTSHCRQIEHSILRYLHCTLLASPSSCFTNKRTHTHPPFMQAVQTVQTDCTVYVHRGPSSISRVSLPLFDRKPPKSAGTQLRQNSNFWLVSFPPHLFFRSKKNVLRPTLMGAFGILFCNNFKRVFVFLFFNMVNGRKRHSCGEEKLKKTFKIIAK